MKTLPPSSIGPYRVLRHLGQGGMGEVFLAHDPRLDREVAIKRLRTDVEISKERLARFRREARIVSRIHHPSIVQVFDLLTLDGVDHLVMEYVDGDNLRTVIERRGPLPVAEVVGAARRVASGLAEAHRHGITHRDLKAENVLFGHNGVVKIADFGLARPTPGGVEDTSLTEEGAVLGTWRAMAPEQLMGTAVDERTDLFAFGVLLYEMLSRRSPFAGKTHRETLSNLLYRQPARLRELGFGAPPELDQLVVELLEKEPSGRPRSAADVDLRLAELEATDAPPSGNSVADVSSVEFERASWEVESTLLSGTRLEAPVSEVLSRRSWPRGPAWALACVLLVAIALGAGWAWLKQPATESRVVAVIEPRILSLPSTGDPELLAFGIRAVCLSVLADHEGISPSRLGVIDAVAEGLSTPELAHAVAADEVLEGTLSCQRADCLLELSRIDGKTGQVISSLTLEVPADELGVIARAIQAQLGGMYPEHRRRSGGESGDDDVPAQIYADYLRLYRVLASATPSGADLQERLRGIDALRRRAPRFVALELLDARTAVRAFLTSRAPALLERADAAIERAAAVRPGDPQVLRARLDLALAVGRADDAETLLEELDALLPGDLRLLDDRSRLLELGDDLEGAYAVQTKTVERRPSWRRLHRHAFLAGRTGRLEVARQSLARLHARAPGNPWGLALDANLEIEHGDLARAAEILEKLNRDRPRPATLSNLGLIYLLRRDPVAAIEVLEEAHRLAPQSAQILLNLADAQHLAGNTSGALALYQQALDAFEKDPVAMNVRLLTARAQALARLDLPREAVAVIQEALRRQPGHSVTLFEAALVYAIVGDLVSAELSARHALDLGYAPRWFRLPAFDALREVPSFASRLGDEAPSP